MRSSAIFVLANFIVTFITSLTPEYYENYVINEGQIRSFETPSIQNCIHKCQFDHQCNIANLKVLTASKIQCVFARVECFEDLHEKMQESDGWYLYKLPEKYCKARPRNLKDDKVSANSTGVSIGGDIDTTVTEIPSNNASNAAAANANAISADSQSSRNVKECSDGGGFKIQHVGSGKYLHYDERNDKMALHVIKTYGDKFCVTGNGYLKQVAFGRCFKKVGVHGIERIALDSDCTSNNANFYFKEGKIYYRSVETFLVTTNNIYIITATICEDELQCQFKLVWS